MVGLLALFSLIVIATLTAVSYYQSREDALRRFRARLERAALATVHILPEDYHAKISGPDSITGKAHRPLADELRTLARELSVEQIYTCMEIDGRIVITVYGGPASIDFFTEYRKVPQILREAFATGRLTHGIYTDEFGTFMSVFLPKRTASGRPFVIGVDDTLREIKASLRKALLQELGLGGLMLAVFLAIQYMVVARMTWPLVALTERTQALAEAGFANDAGTPVIDAIAARQRDEIGHLAASFAHMERELRRHIASLQAETAARERIERELSIAREIQHQLLPATFPPFPNRLDVDLYAMMEPARSVGGDLYDFFLIDHDRLFFMIGDVSDKGVPAALYMAILRALFKTEILVSRVGLAQAMRHVNRFLSEHNQAQMFATVFAGVVDLRTGRVEYSDAGHEPPFLLRAGEDPALMSKAGGGVALGVLVDADYGVQELTLAPGDGLFLYTDGVNEAMDPQRKLFTTHRIHQTLRTAGKTMGSKDLIHAVLASVTEFVSDAAQSDDITMLTLRYLGVDPGDAVGAPAAGDGRSSP